MHSVSAQVYKRIPVDLSGKLHDVISIDDRIHIVASDGIYDFNNLTAEKLAILDEKTIMPPLQNYSDTDEAFYYPMDFGGYTSYDKHKALMSMESGNVEDGIILKRKDGTKWLINSSLYRLDLEEWSLVKSFDQYPSFSDGKVLRNKIFLSSYGKGIYILNDRLEVERFTEEEGLSNDYCTSLCLKNESEIYVGHRGGLSIVKGAEIEKVNLQSQIGKAMVTELEMDKEGKLWGLTGHVLFYYFNDEINKIKIELKPGEKLESFHISDDQNLWVLSDRAMYLLPNNVTPSWKIVNKNREGKLVDFYNIRGKDYYSDGKSVYSLDAKKNSWQKELRKKAPEHVLTYAGGHPILVFANNKGMCLHSKSAKKLKGFTIPDEEEISCISKIGRKTYYSTENNLYEKIGQEFKLISPKEDHYYSLVEASSSVFAFGESGIYKMTKDEMVPLLSSYNNHSYPPSRNQFLLEDKLATFTRNSIHLIDSEDESLDVIQMAPLNILDIKEQDVVVWVLCSKSLIAISKSELLKGKLEIIKTLPLYQEIENGKLYQKNENELWAVSKNDVFRVDVHNSVSIYKPKFDLHKIINVNGKQIHINKKNITVVKQDDLPLEIEYKATNYWTDKIKYAFHINHDGKNISEWKSHATCKLENREAGRYTINAKYKDDIYGLSIEAEPLIVELPKTVVIEAGASRLFIIPIMIISLVVLLLIGLLGKRIKYNS